MFVSGSASAGWTDPLFYTPPGIAQGCTGTVTSVRKGAGRTNGPTSAMGL